MMDGVAPDPVTTDVSPRSVPPWWRDLRNIRIGLQVGFLLLFGGGVLWMALNLATNLDRLGIRRDFAFLGQPAGFSILGAPDFRAQDTIRQALLLGFVNAIRVAILGIVLSLVLGVLVGIARLSSNWLVARSASAFVEGFRNIPPLVLVIFFYLSVVAALPRLEDAVLLGEYAIVSNRGIWVAWIDRGPPLSMSLPVLDGRVVTGGLWLYPEYVSLLLALVLYAASFIAEIVRGSILAVDRGQREAADSLGLRSGQRMRLIILPQALRIATPAIGNESLNLAKNVSLGIAVGFAEILRVANTAAGNGQPAPQLLILVLLAYLSLSIVVSVIFNGFNRRLQLVER
jgi:general L-amino acid transport system permease protein